MPLIPTDRVVVSCNSDGTYLASAHDWREYDKLRKVINTMIANRELTHPPCGTGLGGGLVFKIDSIALPGCDEANMAVVSTILEGILSAAPGRTYTRLT